MREKSLPIAGNRRNRFAKQGAEESKAQGTKCVRENRRLSASHPGHTNLLATRDPPAHQINANERFHESGIHCRVHIGRPGDRLAFILCITSTPPDSRRRTVSDQFITPKSRRSSAGLRYRSLVCDSATQLTPPWVSQEDKRGSRVFAIFEIKINLG
jgi:hypothetical protein